MKQSFLRKSTFFVAIAMFVANAMASTISIDGTKVSLSLDNETGDTYKLTRSIGRYGIETELTNFTEHTLYEETPSENTKDLYYHIYDSKDSLLEHISLEINLLGKNSYVYRPTDNMESIQNEVHTIAEKMLHEQFGLDRYAFLFMPGDYTEAGSFDVSYYMSISGLSLIPHNTKLNNIKATCPLSGSNVTCSFWRSIENFKVVNTGDNEYMWWAVSQAAPMRRIVSERQTLFDYGKSASGGFAADCDFRSASSGWAQQQWYSRNCYMERATNGIGIPGWNHAYQGIEFGPGVNISKHSDNWSASSSVPQWGALSREETTPIIREKAFLYVDKDGNYKVFRPSLRYDSKGVSYTEEDPGEGDSFDLLEDFYIAYPSTTADEINTQLNAGKHLYLTPGIYSFDKPIIISKANTIVLGSGYATLTATQENTEAIMIVEDVDNVTIASVLFDTYYSSKCLLLVGREKSDTRHIEQPTILSDVIFRIGGVVKNNTNADVALKINSNDVLGDHFWIWRADHGDGVGWYKNTSKNGIIVNGDHVTIYGLFNEHFQEYQTLWNGEYGRTYFYQCETPYDVAKQSEYMSHDGSVNGYAGYKVADNVKHHYASMLGLYDVFIRVGEKILIHSAVEVPKEEDVVVHHACNYGLSGNVSRGGFEYVVNECAPSTATRQGRRYQVVNYCMVGIDNTLEENGASVSIWPNPATDYITIETEGNEVANVYVCDLAGRSIIQTTNVEPISLSNLSVGTYLVYISRNGVNSVHKILKK